MRIAVFAVLALATASASADDIGPPPADCAPGSIPFSSHAGEWCEDTVCTTDADCDAHQQYAARLGGERLTCREVRSCVDDASAAPGRTLQEGPRGSVMGPGRRVLSPCDARGACATGSCLAARRCVRASQVVAAPGGASAQATASSPPVSSPPSSGPASSGCAAALGSSGGAASAAWLALLGLALALTRKRS